jgi:hypothetical protein
LTRLRALWARLTSPDHLSIEVNLAGVTFKASGNQSYVITAYTIFVQQIQDSEPEAQAETHLQPLPHFRGKPAGTC